MAGGGLMQLVAYGAQDLYLTHEPQITFFKVVYRRHTNFAVESIEQTVSGSQKFGGKCTVNVSRNGDLINNVLVEVDIPKETATADASFDKHFGYALLKEVAVYIGGQEIDRQYSHWMSVWSELTLSNEQKSCLGQLVNHDSSQGTAGTSTETVMVPLQFWFCRDNGLALPLIALQYHEVKLEIMLSKADSDGVGEAFDDNDISAVRCWCDYVFLDTEERRKFAQTRHEYLIEQVQKQTEALTAAGTTTKAKLEFNHPVKELVWFVPQRAHNYASTGNIAFNNMSSNWMTEAVLKLNNTDRFKTRKSEYFNWVQPYQHHTGCPKKGTYVYSFALNPEKHQPSGTCNFSRIDSAILNMKRSSSDVSPHEFDGSIHIYATNYNVLRIMSGMGGLAYSN